MRLNIPMEQRNFNVADLINADGGWNKLVLKIGCLLMLLAILLVGLMEMTCEFGLETLRVNLLCYRRMSYYVVSLLIIIQ